jgi:hypothetical protein
MPVEALDATMLSMRSVPVVVVTPEKIEIELTVADRGLPVKTGTRNIVLVAGNAGTENVWTAVLPKASEHRRTVHIPEETNTDDVATQNDTVSYADRFSAANVR